jgi:hypothetical protein
MEKKISPGLKTTFLIHFIAALFFGFFFLLIPEIWGNLVNWPIKDPPVYRLLGAALMSFGVSSWLAYKATTWENVKIVVQMEIVWTVLGSLVTLWALLFAGLPVFGWVNVVILAAFAVAFGFFYSQK